tara:strand:- start:447 stop:620 length:174 start_codon:yes stop_codon:yes gene_type:complete
MQLSSILVTDDPQRSGHSASHVPVLVKLVLVKKAPPNSLLLLPPSRRRLFVIGALAY